jgi:hypothetical protein
MADYQSYSTYVAPEESQETPYREPVARDTGVVTSVTVRNGEMASEVSHNTRSIKASELTPYESSDWRSTALKPSGTPAREILPETIVSLGGTQGRVQDFVAAGILQEGPGGYELAPAIDESPQAQEDLSDTPGMPQEIVNGMDAAMEVFDDKTLEAGVSLGISHLTGEVDFNAVVRKLAMGSGKEPGDVQQRAQFILGAYQAQADSYLAKQGIGKEDLQDFYEFTRTRKGDMRAALEQQIRQSNLSGWKPLVSKFLSSTAPSLQALQENGFQTKTVDNVAQVRIQGMWMSLKAAAKAGYI